MAIGTFGRATLSTELNRLANGGTYPTDDKFLGDLAAANAWAGTNNLGLLGALNVKAGITNPSQYLGLNGVCNLLAGTTGKECVEALRLISA